MIIIVRLLGSCRNDKQVTALDTKDITNGFQTIFATVSEQLGTLHQKLEELGGLGQKVTITVEKNLPYFETGGDPDMNAACEKFATQLNVKIKNRVGGISSSEIAKEVETNGKDGILTDKRNPTNDSDLTLAVDGILPKLASKARTAAAKLGWLIGSGDTDGKIGNVEAAIRVVNSLGDHLAGEIKKTDSPSQGQTNLGYDIQAKLGTAATNSEVDTKLGELLQQAVKNGIDKLNKKVKNIVDIELRDVHPTIDEQINRLNNAGIQPGNIRKLVNGLEAQINGLKPLVSGVNDEAGGLILRQVGDLRRRVGELKDSIAEINSAIKEFNKSFLAAIEAAKSASQQARKELSEGIDGLLQTHLTQQLKKLVSAQNKLITEIIENDKKKGLKGLLKEMYKDSGSKIMALKLERVEEKEQFKTLSERFKDYLELIFTYIKGQLNTPSSSPPNSTTKEPTKMLGEVQSKLGNLLTHLGTAKHFDSLFVLRLESFSTELGKFTPSQFAGPNNSKLLDSLRDGLQKLCDQLDKAYVSAYSGDYWNGNNKNKYANVFCTIMHTFRRDFDELRDGLSGAMYDKSIHLANSNSLGSFFKGCNYNVSKTLANKVAN
ncbi:hypothetical protein, conserved [Babesia ovata]|uniref:Extracellular matrix-binding ebh n=1 Tax=Babesia ovata TaxID=189622 RepID=A0A2H6KK44_9APIC|nr:uncharacterized protein BOVATA_048420 [Babesia ovata]GBE63349.1 hypothetical protein, conserved [Babesia ovata]